MFFSNLDKICHNCSSRCSSEKTVKFWCDGIPITFCSPQKGRHNFLKKVQGEKHVPPLSDFPQCQTGCNLQLKWWTFYPWTAQGSLTPTKLSLVKFLLDENRAAGLALAVTLTFVGKYLHLLGPGGVCCQWTPLWEPGCLGLAFDIGRTHLQC